MNMAKGTSSGKASTGKSPTKGTSIDGVVGRGKITTNGMTNTKYGAPLYDAKTSQDTTNRLNHNYGLTPYNTNTNKESNRLGSYESLGNRFACYAAQVACKEAELNSDAPYVSRAEIEEELRKLLKPPKHSYN